MALFSCAHFSCTAFAAGGTDVHHFHDVPLVQEDGRLDGRESEERREGLFKRPEGEGEATGGLLLLGAPPHLAIGAVGRSDGNGQDAHNTR